MRGAGGRGSLFLVFYRALFLVATYAGSTNRDSCRKIRMLSYKYTDADTSCRSAPTFLCASDPVLYPETEASSFVSYFQPLPVCGPPGECLFCRAVPSHASSNLTQALSFFLCGGRHLSALTELGVAVVPPASKKLACGDIGKCFRRQACFQRLVCV